MTNLPAGALHYPWRGYDYWHVGFGWYRPCWVGDSVYYGWVYPPVGYYYASLPPSYETTVINNVTYYQSEGVYYQEGEQNGQKGYVVAESPVPSEPATQEAPGNQPGGDNPFVILKGMCDYLSGLSEFSVMARTTSDEVSAAGDTIQVTGRRAVSVSRPGRFAFEANGDNGSRRCVYDGRTVSLMDRTRNFYTVVKVPDSIEAALDVLAQDYGITVPLEDLLYRDLYKRLEPRISAGQYLGLHSVDGVACHHLAFAGDKASFEIWVDAGDKPMPRKLAIDYSENSVRSRYSAEFGPWNASPTFSSETFEFKPPDGARRIEIAPTQREASQ